MTKAKVRTLSMRAFAALSASAFVAVLAGGVALGYGLARGETASPVAPVPDRPERRFVLDRLGKLSARLISLEQEATTLAGRIDVVQDFEARTRGRAGAGKDAAPPAAGRAAPSGGPMMPPLGAVLGPSQPGEGAGATLGMSELERALERLDARLEAIDRAAAERNLALMTFPSRLPVAGPRTSRFGNRFDPFTGRAAFHSGLDFAAPLGTPIHASAGGRVIYAGFRGEYGRAVEIDHGNGLVTRYAHTSRLFVKVGDVVTPGQLIAAVGSTGRSTGPHLHFEVIRDRAYVDPALYLARS